jgi:hypothetical protein
LQEILGNELRKCVAPSCTTISPLMEPADTREFPMFAGPAGRVARGLAILPARRLTSASTADFAFAEGTVKVRLLKPDCRPASNPA